tara:strand:- start:83 stop:454 length:372 start_codon:yes stop_codon:yes gene_type:complete
MLLLIERPNGRELELHHGDCKGADADAHEVVHAMLWPRIEAHPCTIESMRAYCKGADIVHAPLPPLKRNHIMVDLCELLIAMPGGMKEEQRSGTWSTYRYAKKNHVDRLTIFPDGSAKLEKGA